LKTLLVTSRVTFVPENYAQFVCRLAASPLVDAVLFLDNRDFGTLMTGVVLWASRLAPGIGRELMKNSFEAADDPREEAFRRAGKPIYRLESINSHAAVELLKDFDIVVNARTRFFYRKAALAAPRIGCLNIHHGLLPEQRGLFCDLWAQGEGRPAGFSIHRMTSKLDDGEILMRCEVPVLKGRSFVEHARASSIDEAQAILETLEKISRTGRIEGRPNTMTQDTRYYTNPTRAEIGAMKKKGLKI
jgi:hypothetical protein